MFALRRMRLRLAISILLSVLAIALPATARDARAEVDSLAALGDSITAGYNACGLGPCWPASWSTGTLPVVNSLASRIETQSGTAVARYNVAVPGARMEHLRAQAATAVVPAPDLITIEMGGNDACRSSLSAMTETGQYQRQFRSAMDVIASHSPGSRVLVMSVPDIYRLWVVLKDSPAARATWAAFGICQSLLADPLSTDAEDVERRLAVRQRVIEYNKRLERSCAKYVNCTYDGGLVFETAFTAADITFDAFHPSLSGQAKLAAAAYAAGAPF